MTDPLDREDWLEVLNREVYVTFGPRVLALDRRVLQEWSLFERRKLADGTIAPTVESLTVATAKAHELIYLTRQSALAQEVGCTVENPWVPHDATDPRA